MGFCCEHRKEITGFIKGWKGIDFIRDGIKAKELHPAIYINVIQLQTQYKGKVSNHIIAVFGHCGKKCTSYHTKWLKLLATTSSTLSLQSTSFSVLRPRFMICTFSSDGCSEWDKAQKQLLAESDQMVDVELEYVPKKVVSKNFLITKDMRHSHKNDYGKISRVNICICGININMQFIDELITDYWSELHKVIPETRSALKYILYQGWTSDKMNVPNALKFYRLCWELCCIIISKYDELPLVLSPLKKKKINAFIIYANINYSYVSSLFNRDGCWKDTLYNLSISSFGGLVLFQACGTKYETSQTWSAKQRYF